MGQTAYIALGSNVGDRDKNIAGAIARLEEIPGIEVMCCATPIETEPVDCPPGAGAFLNSAAELHVGIGFRELLVHLMLIETQMGRQQSSRNAPRLIDLDLLLFGDTIHDRPGLTIPHRHLHERLFVLIPLAEIAPDVVHPILNRSIRALRDQLTRPE